MTNMWWGGVRKARLALVGTARAAAILCLIAGFAILPGLTSPAEAQSRISAIVVEGNQRVDDATVLSYAGLEVGETASPADLNAAFQGLTDSGLFETVEVQPRGGTVVIQVSERPILNRITYEGNRVIKDEELATLVRSVPRRVYSAAQAEADAAAIVSAYEVRGNIAASVEARIIRRPNNRVDLVFEIAEGRVTENARVSFVGNREYSDRRLRRVLQTKQAGILRALFSSDTFIADRIAFDRRILSDFYQSRGYVDFQVLDVSTELSRDRRSTFITFQLREGQQFRLGDITVTTDMPGVDPEEFRDTARLKSGVIYSPTLIERAISRMEGLALRKGIDFARIEPRVTRNDRELTLDIEFSITRGPRVFVERIDISGNKTTLDRVIRRQFRSVEGDPFNPREIRAAADRIRALGYFSNVDVQSREGSGSDRVLIDVEVEEQPTGTFGVGATYSTQSGIGFNVNFAETNFLGRGQTVRFDLNTTSGSGNSQLVFVEPYFLGRDLTFSTSIYQRSSTGDNAVFDTETLGANVALGFPAGEFSRLRTRVFAEQSELSGVSTASSDILQAEEGKVLATGVGYTWTYDTRNDGYDPDSGFLVSFGQDFAGLGGDATYVRSTARVVAQKRLRNEDYTLRASAELGNISAFGDYTTRLPDRYFLSSRQMRGFEYRGIGPRDLGADNNDPLGGNSYFTARFEFGFPIGFAEEAGISGGLFYDVGTVWGLDDTAGTGGPVDDGFYLRSAVGLAIFWDTPVGPLQLNFSEVVTKEDYDIPQSFDLQISTRF